MGSNKVITLDSSSAEELLDQIDLAQTKLLPELKEVLHKSEELKASIDSAGRSLFDGAKEIEAANKKDNELEKQIEKFIEQFVLTTGNLRSMVDNGVAAQKESEKILDRLEGLDLDFVKEVTQISFEDLIKRVISAQQKNFIKQKLSVVYLITVGIGLFMFGAIFGVVLLRFVGA